MKEKAQKQFSLVETGIVELPHTRLLLVNRPIKWDFMITCIDSCAGKRHTRWADAYRGLHAPL